MRYRSVVGVLCLAIAADLGVYIATSDDARASFDPRRPATLLSIPANRARALRAQVSEAAKTLVTGFTAPVHDRAKRDLQADVPQLPQRSAPR
jgi:hypothetical protein